MDKLNQIKLIVLDVDGTMTDGGVYIDSHGVESKKFNIKDGAGIMLAESVGIDFMILTGRKSACVEKRAKELKIKYVYQDVKDKGTFLRSFMKKNGIKQIEVAYIGDDLNDLSGMACSGVKACPQDAVIDVKEFCDYVIPVKGGYGVIRGFVDLLLKAINKYATARNTLFPII